MNIGVTANKNMFTNNVQTPLFRLLVRLYFEILLNQSEVGIWRCGSVSIELLFVDNIYVLTTFALNNIFCDKQVIGSL